MEKFMLKTKTISIYFKFIFLMGIINFGYTNADLNTYGEERLKEIHSRITLLHGNIMYEYPEQLMVATFLPPDAKVLELGSDVGRNTCVIATILNDSSNLVTVEPREEAHRYLRENRDYNNLKFHIETSALSKIPLVQKGWITIPSIVDLEGYTRIPTITFQELKKKYKIKFDTLVIDCEGALYYILKDEPNLLKKIKLIIMENDFSTPEHYQFVANLFKANGLQLVYNEGRFVFENNAFYQVWKKP